MTDDPIEQALASARRYESAFDKSGLAAAPARGLAVVCCMDARIRVHRMLGLHEGDAHVIRNAGGVVTDDTIRSLAISQRKLGTRAVMVIQHTKCGMQGLDAREFRQELARDVGEEPEWNVGAFDDLYGSVRDSVARLRESAYLVARDNVRGFVYDVEDGSLREVP